MTNPGKWPDLGSTFKNKKVLVAGGTGMVGQQLVRLLLGFGAKGRVASLDHPYLAHPEAEFKRLDLTVGYS
jgi:FlaA1/EpsC-like NDP-sugar epimerase